MRWKPTQFTFTESRQGKIFAGLKEGRVGREEGLSWRGEGLSWREEGLSWREVQGLVGGRNG